MCRDMLAPGGVIPSKIALRRIARDIVVLTPREFERDRSIPGTVARPAAAEGRVLYERPA
jgi:hypothetical protein